MLEAITNFIMELSIMAGIFLTTRYVFLEPAMEEKKQRLFYIISFTLVLFINFFIGESLAQTTYLFLGGLNIALGRKKHRLVGFLLIFPIAGIIDGIAAPILMASILKDKSVLLYYIVTLITYFILDGLLIVFYFKGKEWRIWFRDNMENRRPQLSESIILNISGVALMVINTMLGALLAKYGAVKGAEYHVLIEVAFVYEIAAFLLSLTIIILIMQGNHRKFYHDRVSDMQFNVIITMADIVENRDSSTGGHIKRTAKYVEIIGKNLKKQNLFPEILTKDYIDDMMVAAPLHDIGKISVPDSILNKPARLTDEEFEIMKKHAIAGYDVLVKAKEQLGDFNYLDVALDMAKYHHEWWNGKGYPTGIKGEEIPLCARIMAVADVFDALTSKRCYKDAMPVEKAYDIIRAESGTHFDPVIAEVFLNSSAEIEEALHTLTDD